MNSHDVSLCCDRPFRTQVENWENICLASHASRGPSVAVSLSSLPSVNMTRTSEVKESFHEVGERISHARRQIRQTFRSLRRMLPVHFSFRMCVFGFVLIGQLKTWTSDEFSATGESNVLCAVYHVTRSFPDYLANLQLSSSSQSVRLLLVEVESYGRHLVTAFYEYGDCAKAPRPSDIVEDCRLTVEALIIWLLYVFILSIEYVASFAGWLATIFAFTDRKMDVFEEWCRAFVGQHLELDTCPDCFYLEF